MAALWSNTTGFYNVADGYGALISNTQGYQNTAIGTFALLVNTSDCNTAVGAQALCSNSNGFWNTAVGFQALFSNIGASDIDFYAGSGNTATGYEALQSNTTGEGNVAIGVYALTVNTEGNDNTACGTNALFDNTKGVCNTAIGFNALDVNSTGGNNTAVGLNSLEDTTTGSDNTAIGVDSGAFWNNTHCTFIGEGAAAYVLSGVTNSTGLGSGADITADNQVRIGSLFVTSIGGQVNFTAFSDSRYKNNISEDVPGLAFIRKLRPITYTLDVEGLDRKLSSMRPKLRIDPSKALKPKEPSTEEPKARKEKGRIVYTGFAAEEVEKAAKELGYQFSGVDAPKNKDDFYGLRYAEFVVPLVKSVQELSAENQQLKKEIATLTAAVKEQAARIQKVSAQFETSKPAPQVVNNP